MTIDERIERLEFQNSAYVEQRRKDWEEYLTRERALQSHIDAIWLRQERRDAELDQRWIETKAEMREMSRRTDERIEKFMAATDERIRDLVVAIGQLIQSKTS